MSITIPLSPEDTRKVSDEFHTFVTNAVIQDLLSDAKNAISFALSKSWNESDCIQVKDVLNRLEIALEKTNG